MGAALPSDIIIGSFRIGEHDVFDQDATLVARVNKKPKCQNRRASHDTDDAGRVYRCSLWTILYSFTKSKLIPVSLFKEGGYLGFINPKAFVGLAQYERLLDGDRNTKWAESVENIATYGIFSLTFSFTVGFILAALIDQKIRFENTFRTIFLYPFALSFVVTGVVWQWMLGRSVFRMPSTSLVLGQHRFPRNFTVQAHGQ